MLTFLILIPTLFALNLTFEKRQLASTCWIDHVGRGAGHPITTCANNTERSGLLCYPYCPKGTTGIGPACWNGTHTFGRGFGHPLGCKSNQEFQNGICYDLCQDGYYGQGPMCVEKCPDDVPVLLKLII